MRNLKILSLISALSLITIPASSMEKGIADSAADYICVKAKEGNKSRLAVYPFTAKDGSASAETDAYATRVIEDIVANGKFHVIDPSKVSKIIEEQEKGLTGLVDPDTAPETGKMLGADVMIFGIAGDGNLQIRMVDSVSGEVIGATVAGSGSSAKVSNDDFKSEKNKNIFFVEQARGRLGELSRNRPLVFLIVTADDSEMKELETEFPRMMKSINTRMMDRDPAKQQRFEKRRKRLLNMRENNPEFNSWIIKMREDAKERIIEKKRKK